MGSNSVRDITALLISRDPFFLFAARGLLGRDRRVRIFDTAASFASLQSNLPDTAKLHAIVCDLDSVNDEPSLHARLHWLLADMPQVKILCLAEGTLQQAPARIGDAPIHALLSKSDLAYCLHLAIRAVVDEEVILLTQRSKAVLPPDSYLTENGRVIRPEKGHPNLSERIAEIAMWRIFIGLDNPDIEDELLLGDDTVRGYVSKVYRSLGANNELEAFDALSDWWWVTRFSGIVGQRP